jgi:hypothetical protein
MWYHKLRWEPDGCPAGAWRVAQPHYWSIHMRFHLGAFLVFALAGSLSPAHAQVQSITVGLHSSCPYGPVG